MRSAEPDFRAPREEACRGSPSVGGEPRLADGGLPTTRARPRGVRLPARMRARLTRARVTRTAYAFAQARRAGAHAHARSLRASAHGSVYTRHACASRA